jgi:hypothetical protein
MVRAGDVTNAAREINRHDAQIVPSPKPRLNPEKHLRQRARSPLQCIDDSR